MQWYTMKNPAHRIQHFKDNNSSTSKKMDSPLYSTRLLFAFSLYPEWLIGDLFQKLHFSIP